MNSNKQYIYIVDVYSPYQHNDDVIYRFIYHNQWWCVRKTLLEWGTPVRESFIDEGTPIFKLYNTEKEAMAFVHELRKGEGWF